jgi:hypothetical protein
MPMRTGPRRREGQPGRVSHSVSSPPGSELALPQPVPASLTAESTSDAIDVKQPDLRVTHTCAVLRVLPVFQFFVPQLADSFVSCKTQFNVFEWFNSSAQIPTELDDCLLLAMKLLNLGSDRLTAIDASRIPDELKKATDFFQLTVVKLKPSSVPRPTIEIRRPMNLSDDVTVMYYLVWEIYEDGGVDLGATFGADGRGIKFQGNGEISDISLQAEAGTRPNAKAEYACYAFEQVVTDQ